MTPVIVPFEKLSLDQRRTAAEILTRAFTHSSTDWGNPKGAREEVDEVYDEEERLAFAAIESGAVIGWIGAIRHHEKSWELHPLAVDPAYQRTGVGSQLIQFLESHAAAKHVETIWFGTDDDFGGTNIHGVDLYPDVLSFISKIKETTGHPVEFYRKHGYIVTGVIPDANGFGKPDIFMAKRIGGGA